MATPACSAPRPIRPRWPRAGAENHRVAVAVGLALATLALAVGVGVVPADAQAVSAGPSTAVTPAMVAAPAVAVGMRAQGQLTDVDGSVHRRAIESLVASGAINGFADGTFRPDAVMTRGQLASLLVRTFELPASPCVGACAALTDIEHDVHRRAIETLVAAGIVAGFDDGTFRSGAPVTRGQSATFLARSLGLPDAASQHPFADLRGSTHERAVAALWSAGITTGRTETTYAPAELVRRGQAASFVVRSLDLERPPRSSVQPDPGPQPVGSAPAPGPDAPAGESPGASAPAPSAPTASTWSQAWSTQELSSIQGWFQRQTGLADPGALSPPSTQQVQSTRPGQVIENLDLDYRGTATSAVHVRHDDVVVRNNRLRAPGARNVIWVDAGLRGVVIEHNELDGGSLDYGTGRDDGNFGNIGVVTRGPVEVIRRNRMVGVRQGAALFPDTRVEENLVLGLHQNAPGVSTSSFGHLGAGWGYAGGTLIRRNLVEAGSSGAITVYSQAAGPARDARFEQNLVVGVGRGFGIRGGHAGENRHELRGIRIEGNRFTGQFGFPNVLGGGTNAAVDLRKAGTSFTDNRWLGSDTDLPARCGTSRDACE